MKLSAYLVHALCLVSGLAFVSTLSAQTGPSFELFATTYQPAAGDSSADFNQDGKPDLLAGTTLALGNGDGTFQTAKTIGTAHGGLIEQVAVGDVNGDGHLDVVLAEEGGSPSTSYIDIFYGNGDGTFQPVASFIPAYYPRSLAIGDFNGDGLLDIAVGDVNGVVEIYLNHGGKTFTPGTSVKITSAPDQVFRLQAGDVDANGTVDLAATTNGSAFVLWGDGHGNFSPVLLGSYNLQQGSVQLSMGDLNQDGNQDIIASYNCGQNNTEAGHGYGTICTDVEVFYGQGNRSTFHRTAIVDTTNAAASFYAVDVNGDGIADLVATVYTNADNQGGMAVYLGHPDGSFDQNGQLFDGSGAGVPGDFNRDGKMDFGSIGGVTLNATPTAPCATSRINPTVTVCAPVDHTYVNSPFQIQATTDDTTTVTALQEYLDGKLVFNQPVKTFNITENGGIGGHLLVTKAFDAKGVSFRSDRYINVYSGTPGATCAADLNTARICLPGGASAAGTTSPVHFLANSSSAALSTAVQLYVDNQLIINTTSGYTAGYNTAIDTNLTLSSGSHYLVFKMFDANGASYSAATTVTIR